jgi:hypothetical protein
MPIRECRVWSLFVVINFNLPFFVIVYTQAFFFVFTALFAVSDALTLHPGLFAIRAFFFSVHQM